MGYILLFITGILLFIYGGYDDSPGGQLLGLVVAVVGFVNLMPWPVRTLLRTKLRNGKDRVVGICEVVMGQSAKKRENKDKILQLMQNRSRAPDGAREVSNSDIREALGISAASVVRYLDELESEGKIEQVGNTGQSVTYRLK